MKKNNNIKITPILAYKNAEEDKLTIYKENKNKSGIYRWNNLITGKSYVGSAVNLTNRLKNYFSTKFLEKELRRNKSKISNSLLKHGYGNFSLDIIEYCESNVLIEREQYYIDTLDCEYNILKIASSRLGFKHSPETLLKFKERKLSSEALINLKLAKRNKPFHFSPLWKNNHLLATAHTTTVINKADNTIKTYESIKAFSRSVGINHVTIKNYANTNKLLRNIYLISTNKL